MKWNVTLVRFNPDRIVNGKINTYSSREKQDLKMRCRGNNAPYNELPFKVCIFITTPEFWCSPLSTITLKSKMETLPTDGNS